jgi:hypothetical protein
VAVTHPKFYTNSESVFRGQVSFGKPPMPDLALPDHFLNGSGNVLDWHIGIDTMLIVEINGFDLKSFERTFDR